MDIILTPPVAFLLYIPLVLIIVGFGKLLAGPEQSNPVKSSVYGSGEAAPSIAASPGYRPFFLIAFFFAVLHLGMLVLGTTDLSLFSGTFLIGLGLALVALILG
jgi:NADH:ubiquinone oxidoreductase subunit 3 (subunit A)